MTIDDPVIERIRREDPAGHAPTSADALAARVRQRVMQAADEAPAGRGGFMGRIGGAVAVAGSVAVVAAVIVVIVLAGHSGSHKVSAAGGSVSSQRADARRLYAPVHAFYESLTPADRRAMQASVKASTDRVNRCQAPYKLLFTAHPGTEAGKSYGLYENGTLLSTYQSRIAPITLKLTTLATALRRLQLSDPKMQAFAQAIATELFASLRAPRFDSCTFIREIAQHHYSFSWAKQSFYGRIAARFWSRLLGAGNRTDAFVVTYIQQAGKHHLFSSKQLSDLVNIPGEVS